MLIRIGDRKIESFGELNHEKFESNGSKAKRYFSHFGNCRGNASDVIKKARTVVILF